MGIIFGRTMETSFEKQREFMLEMNQVTIERNIQMQNQMRERMAALQIAKARESFVWLISFYGIASIASIRGFRSSGKQVFLSPLLPLTFVVAYQYDLAYGTKLNRIKSEAENVLMFESDLVESPAGLPTVSSLDLGRLRQAEESKYKAMSFPQK